MKMRKNPNALPPRGQWEMIIAAGFKMTRADGTPLMSKPVKGLTSSQATAIIQAKVKPKS